MQRLYWDEYTYAEIEEIIKRQPLVILPIGSVEAHGHHLPLSTDMLQPLWLAEEIAKRINALILPPIHYGWTQGLSSFPGTISISFNSLKGFVKDILSEVAKHGIRKIMVLSGHASTNHMAALRLACEDVLKKYNDLKIMLLSDYNIAYQYRGKLVPEDDSHAGIIETSRIIAIRPELVKENYKFKKNSVGKYIVQVDYKEMVPYATFSNPEGANKELGEKLNNMILEELLKIIKENFEI